MSEWQGVFQKRKKLLSGSDGHVPIDKKPLDGQVSNLRRTRETDFNSVGQPL
jgi:hypothetical protein